MKCWVVLSAEAAAIESNSFDIDMIVQEFS